MDKPDTAPSREERLAAKLRENLRRRKTQTRAKAEAMTAKDGAPLPNGDSKG